MFFGYSSRSPCVGELRVQLLPLSSHSTRHGARLDALNSFVDETCITTGYIVSVPIDSWLRRIIFSFFRSEPGLVIGNNIVSFLSDRLLLANIRRSVYPWNYWHSYCRSRESICHSAHLQVVNIDDAGEYVGHARLLYPIVSTAFQLNVPNKQAIIGLIHWSIQAEYHVFF